MARTATYRSHPVSCRRSAGTRVPLRGQCDRWCAVTTLVTHAHAARNAMRLEQLRDKAAWITERLRDEYGRRAAKSSRHPTDCLIATILSQHTADRNSGAALAALQEHYTSWSEVAYADTSELAATIRGAGLANQKARHIQRALREVERRHGHMDLEFLKSLPMAEARHELLTLPGVGPKTAACVLLFSCCHPALPVDTHVHRLARRLGLIGPRDSADAAHELLEDLVPAQDVLDFHVNLILHGRRVCRAQHPRCGECILQGRCDHFQQARGSM